jgi:Catalytic LigB subunit of aromatic ring-opening dioxygenase
MTRVAATGRFLPLIPIDTPLQIRLQPQQAKRLPAHHSKPQNDLAPSRSYDGQTPSQETEPAMSDHSHPKSLTSRRQILLGGSALAVASGLAGWWRQSGAAEVPPEPPDDRPLMTGRAPAIFIGHGSPMNAIQDNDFTRTLRQWGRELGLPKAILVVSAHWLTQDEVKVSLSPRPQTIHDFGGFPAQLNTMAYPAPGAPEFARRAASRLGPQRIGLADDRGLDHGAWTVLHHLYPSSSGRSTSLAAAPSTSPPAGRWPRCVTRAY